MCERGDIRMEILALRNRDIRTGKERMEESIENKLLVEKCVANMLTFQLIIYLMPYDVCGMLKDKTYVVYSCI